MDTVKLEFTDKQRDELQKIVRTEVQKRGIYLNGFNKFFDQTPFSQYQIETTSIQMSPAIFAELHIEAFASICKCEDVEDVYDIFIPLEWRYEHYNGGSNGCDMMTIVVRYFPNKKNPDYGTFFLYTIR